MNRFLSSFFHILVRRGSLVVTDAGGKRSEFGDGSGNPVHIRFKDVAAEKAILRDPELKVGELYMEGDLIMEAGTIYDLLELVLNTSGQNERTGWMQLVNHLRFLSRRLAQHNSPIKSRENVAHHYDLDSALYRLFLDSDQQYSCAYFEKPDDDLETAQLAKKRHIAAKMYLSSGQNVLDIGCGWGGMGLYLATCEDLHVEGVTLSKEQHGIANGRAREMGLSNRVDFSLKDYRHIEKTYDRIVSIGMFEHVGLKHFEEFFNAVHDLLEEDGVMLLHSIGRADGPYFTNPWIEKYIFPGGYIPALSEVLPAIEKAGLYVTDIEILRLHYAETLKAWRERFLARWEEAEALYDARFCRMWEFYLACSETAFRYQNTMVFQIQLCKDQSVLPTTRNYMHEAENTLRQKEEKSTVFRAAGQ
ncbi:MAG: cyclopropane-fatty-acyl-phospholipid synthase family protein [Stappiaceae bacterium]